MFVICELNCFCSIQNGILQIREVSKALKASVLCIPARDEADALVATLLARLLEQQGVRAEGLQVITLPEALSLVSDAKPTIVCISALPPFAFNHARELYAKLRTQFPQLHVVVCLWNFDGNPESAAARLKLAASDKFLTTLPQALAHVSALIQKRDPVVS